MKAHGDRPRFPGRLSGDSVEWGKTVVCPLFLCEIDPQRLITIPNRPILRWAKGYVTDGRQEGWDITPTGHAVIEYSKNTGRCS